MSDSEGKLYHSIASQDSEDEKQSQMTDVFFLPGAKQSIERLMSYPSEGEITGDIAEIGDEKVHLVDVKGLVRPDEWSGPENQYLSDETMNAMTSLFCQIEKEVEICYFSTLLVQEMIGIYMDSELSEQESSKKLEGIVLSHSRPRSGQLRTFKDSHISFAPCIVNGNHRVGFRVCRRALSVEYVDILGSNTYSRQYGALFSTS